MLLMPLLVTLLLPPLLDDYSGRCHVRLLFLLLQLLPLLPGSAIATTAAVATTSDHMFPAISSRSDSPDIRIECHIEESHVVLVWW